MNLVHVWSRGFCGRKTVLGRMLASIRLDIDRYIVSSIGSTCYGFHKEK